MFTQKQIAALRYLLFKAKDGTDLSKRVLAFLIEQSDGLSREVCLTLAENQEGYAAEEILSAAFGVHGMLSGNGTTHINRILHAMESDLLFSHHSGDFDPTRKGDPFSSGLNRSSTGFTFWLAKEYYSRQANLVSATREELEKINLKKSGLYPEIERD
jgi:hypothetical protein